MAVGGDATHANKIRSKGKFLRALKKAVKLQLSTILGLFESSVVEPLGHCSLHVVHQRQRFYIKHGQLLLYADYCKLYWNISISGIYAWSVSKKNRCTGGVNMKPLIFRRKKANDCTKMVRNILFEVFPIASYTFCPSIRQGMDFFNKKQKRSEIRKSTFFGTKFDIFTTRTKYDNVGKAQ